MEQLAITIGIKAFIFIVCLFASLGLVALLSRIGGDDQ